MNWDPPAKTATDMAMTAHVGSPDAVAIAPYESPTKPTARAIAAMSRTGAMRSTLMIKVEAGDDVFDVRLLIGDVAQRATVGAIRATSSPAEAPGPVQAVRDHPAIRGRPQRAPRAGHRRREGLVQLGPHLAARAVPLVQFGERAVVHDPAVVDDDEAATEPLDVGQIVRGEHHGRVAPVAQLGQEPPHACLLTTSSPMVGSSRKSTSGPCSSEIVSSPRMRCPSESWRTGMSRNSSRSSRSRQSGQPGRVVLGRHPPDVSGQFERLAQGQVLPELGALPEDDADAPPPAGGARPPAHRPQTRTSPLVGISTPVNIFSVVDLPAPFGPR